MNFYYFLKFSDYFFHSIIYLFIYLFIYFTTGFIPPALSTLQLFHFPYLLPTPCLHEDVPTPNPTRPLNSLGPPVSWGLGASSLTEPRPSSPLLYMCWGPHISCCMLPGWWFSVWEISGVQVNWDGWPSYRVSLLLIFFQLFPNSTTAASVHWLGVNICIWLFELLVGSFGGQSW